MSTSPRDQHALQFNAPKPAARVAQPGEHWASFANGADVYVIELRTHAAVNSCEVQIILNGELLEARLFHASLSHELTPRELAVQWAETARARLEHGT